MSRNSFFSMISRMKYINRWALMRNTKEENLDTHTKEVAVIAHALAVLGNIRLGKSYNADRAATLALYHDAHEILTGDMPTPVKYKNPEILSAFKGIEDAANRKIASMLPPDMEKVYLPLLTGEDDKTLMPLIKAADKIAALIKCVEERKAGNTEFLSAEKTIRENSPALKIKEAQIFLEEFLSPFEETLDDMSV
ncbi:MAG TPA: 5'-deoxynucleotidase [Oscillospiraceae bacterium]|nr:5'-deoxynucleotidase [Oscillospiraceae bacterium]